MDQHNVITALLKITCCESEIGPCTLTKPYIGVQTRDGGKSPTLGEFIVYLKCLFLSKLNAPTLYEVFTRIF